MLTTERPAVGAWRTERGVALAVLALAAAAWVTVSLTHGTSLDHHRLGGLLGAGEASHDQPHTHDHDHHAGGAPAAEGPSALGPALLVLGGWSVMVVAMMLPPALPLVQTMHRLLSRRRARTVLLGAGVAAFVAVWTIAGVVLLAGDAVLHAVAEARPGLRPAYVTGAVLVAAGVYQLTPLKRACLRACRSPRSFALAHWRGRRPALVELATLSAAYGVVCVGCCWALMAVSLAVGAAALPVMVVLAALMAAERLVGWGRRLVVPTGVVLVVLGALAALGLVPVESLPG